MIKLYPAIIAIYEQLLNQATLRKGWKFTPKKNDRLLICQFIKWCNKTYLPTQLTEDFLITYFEFQFSRYSGISTPHGKNSIMLNWLIGAKAMHAWRDRNPKKRYFVRWQCSKEFRLQLKKAFTKKVKVNQTSFMEVVNAHEEHEKRRFYNKPTGYVYCADMTTLYNPASKLCNSCRYRVRCKERLRANFEKLYQKRMQYESAI